MTDVTIICNHVPRDILDAWELTPDERAQFDYLDWDAIERGEDSASFFRYKGQLYDIGDLPYHDTRTAPQPDPFAGWHVVLSDSFFSGILVRHDCEGERVIVGRYYC